jgi:hypothetical protein
MKKLGLATALVLSLAFGAGSVFAAKQNANTTPAAGGGSSAGTMSKHHRRHHRRHHRGHKKAAANTNS